MFPDELISDLRSAYGCHGRQEVREDGLCGIFIGNFNEIGSRTHSETICELNVSISDEPEDKCLGLWWNPSLDYQLRLSGKGKPTPAMPGEWKTSPARAAGKEFLKLASQLGASLPLDIRGSLNSEFGSNLPPCAHWCLLLLRDIEQRNREGSFGGVSNEPFRNSLDLVERLSGLEMEKTLSRLRRSRTELLALEEPGADFSQVQVDFGRQSVSYKGKTEEIGSDLEFSLLAVLVDARGSYVPIETLSDRVWGQELLWTGKATIQQRVSGLRRKLKTGTLAELKVDGTTKRNHYRLLIDA